MDGGENGFETVPDQAQGPVVRALVELHLQLSKQALLDDRGGARYGLKVRILSRLNSDGACLEVLWHSFEDGRQHLVPAALFCPLFSAGFVSVQDG